MPKKDTKKRFSKFTSFLSHAKRNYFPVFTVQPKWKMDNRVPNAKKRQLSPKLN